MKTVLITGGSSGIGFEISKYFAKDHYKIVWVSLLEKELEESKKKLQQIVLDADIDTLTMDLSKPEAAQKTHAWVQSNNWTIDVLVNNAGFGTYGYANDIPIDKEVMMINLNVLNVFKMTRLFLKDMLQHNKGTIINISSNTSFQPVPKMSAYAATKSFVKHYSQSLAEEMKTLKTKVRIITVCPAAIKNTRFKGTAKMESIKTFEGLLVTSKEEVAKDIWNAFKKGKNFVVTGAKLRKMMWMYHLIPNSFIQFLLKKELQEK